MAIGRGHTVKLSTLVFPAFSKLAAKHPFFTIKTIPTRHSSRLSFCICYSPLTDRSVDFLILSAFSDTAHAQISLYSHLFYLTFVQVYSSSPSCQARWRKYAKPLTKTFWVSPNSPNTVLSRPRVANTRPVTIWEGKLTEYNSHFNMWILLVILILLQSQSNFNNFIFSYYYFILNFFSQFVLNIIIVGI